MKNFLRILICCALGVFAIARIGISKESPVSTAAAEKKPTGKKANAKSLLASAKKALAAMIKAARADKGLDPKVAKNKPFWKSLQTIAKNLDAAEKGLAAKSNDFFKAVAAAREAEAQMKVDWQLTDSKNKSVIADGKKLGHAIALLRTDFSKEAARKKKGGELTAKEKAAFEKIKAGQKDLLAKIAKLRKEAKKDKALEKGLRKMEKQARHILKEPATVDAYVATLYLLDEQAGWVRGYEYYVDKPWRGDYEGLVRLETSYDTLYEEWETSYEYTSWDSLEVSVDIYESEEVEVTESITTEETSSEESYVESESFDMTEAEEEEVAEAEDTDAEVEADDQADEDSMEDESDDEGEDMSDDEPDDSGGDDDGGDDGE